MNTSKILSMLGEMNVVFCGMIGADSNGELIQKKLANCHLNVWWVLCTELQSSCTRAMTFRFIVVVILIFRKFEFSAGVWFAHEFVINFSSVEVTFSFLKVRFLVPMCIVYVS